MEIAGIDNYIKVRSSFCDVLPELRRPGLSDDTARVDLCVGQRDVLASLAPADARRLAQEILQAGRSHRTFAEYAPIMPEIQPLASVK